MTHHRRQHDACRRALELAWAGSHEEALELLREHLLAHPGDGEALNDAGALLYALGRYDEAARHLARAADRLGDDAVTARQNLAEALLAEGRTADAGAMFDELAPDGLLTGDFLRRWSAARGGEAAGVSVICAAEDGEEPAEAVRSALAQTHRAVEAVLAAPPAVLAATRQAVGDRRLRTAPVAEGTTHAAAWNAGLAAAAGTYVAFLAPGDRLADRHVETLVAALSGSRNCLAAYADAWRVVTRRVAGRRLTLCRTVPDSRPFDRATLRRRPYVPRPGLLAAREALDAAGPFDPADAPLSVWALHRRLARQGDFLHVPEPLAVTLVDERDLPTAEDLAGERADPADDAPRERAIRRAGHLEADGCWRQAAEIYRALARRRPCDAWLAEAAAVAGARADHGEDEALALCEAVNRDRPTPRSLLLAARLLRQHHRADEALDLLRRAEAHLAATDKGREPRDQRS